MRRSFMALCIVLALLGVVASVGVVRAELTATAVVYAWDIKVFKYQNSNVIIPWYNGWWVPFWHEMTFNNDPWLGTPNPCTTGTSEWAGIMYYGVYHEDTQTPTPGPGFQHTRNWELVECDRDGDGKFSNNDLSYAPPTSRTTLVSCRYATDPLFNPICELVSADIVTPCSTGNCTSELITTFLVNLDVNCDGDLADPGDLPVPASGLCWFAESQVPYVTDPGPMWSGPLQGRIAAGGGSKTVNFNPQPLAVELASFKATPQAWTRTILLEWETVSEVDNVGFNLYRAESPTGQQIRLNASLIPSKGPGSPIGFKYSFVDRTARAGRTYYYWLEDLSTYGAYTQHGPVKATIPLLIGVPKPSTP